MRKPKAKRGRPAKDPEEKIRWAISVRFNKADYARVAKLAREAGVSLSQYVASKLDL